MDDRLRALERAVRADPSDVGASLLFAHALEGAGQREAAWLERCRVARDTDDERAWAALTRALAAPERVEVVAERRLDGLARDVVSDGRVVVFSGSTDLLAHDAATLEPHWIQPEPRPPRQLLVAGPRLVHADDRDLVVRELTDGRVLTRRQVVADEGMVVSVAASDRRVVAFSGRSLPHVERATALDLESGATSEWPIGAAGVVGRGMCLVPSRGRTHAHDLWTGAAAWSAEGQAWDADHGGGLLLRDGGRGALELACVDLRDGRERWTWLVSAEHPVFHVRTPDDLLVIATSPSPWTRTAAASRLDVVAVDRRTGDARWTNDDEVGPHAVACLGATREVVYVLHGVPSSGPAWRSLELLVLDAATGARRGRCALPLDPPGAPRRVAGMVVVDHGVLVISGGEPGRQPWSILRIGR